MTKAVNTRELILGILIEVDKNDAYSHSAIRDVQEKYQYLDKKDRAFIKRVAEGTIERQIELDYIISNFSKVKPSKIKPVILNILRMSVYQLKYMDHVPASAVCNEAVKLAERKSFHNLKGYVNGVLRNISRNPELTNYSNKEGDVAEYLSVTYSMPMWIIRQWMKVYSYDTIEQMLRGLLEERPTTIRCNLVKCSVEELIQKLNKEGVIVNRHPYLPYALEISGFDYLYALDSFRTGMFQVQDVSSMLVAEIAAPLENATVIDVCASPGGKALHMSDKLHGGGYIEARDLTEYKIALIKENIERNHAGNIRAVMQDALVLCSESIEKADIVLADLPCSGLGIIGRKKDIKYKMSEEKQELLVQLQRDILTMVQQYVKPGGVLIYSTCTINMAENAENVKWFTGNHPFKTESLDTFLCDELQSAFSADGYLQLLPGVHRTDGFFITKLRKLK